MGFEKHTDVSFYLGTLRIFINIDSLKTHLVRVVVSMIGEKKETNKQIMRVSSLLKIDGLMADQELELTEADLPPGIKQSHLHLRDGEAGMSWKVLPLQVIMDSCFRPLSCKSTYCLNIVQ